MGWNQPENFTEQICRKKDAYAAFAFECTNQQIDTCKYQWILIEVYLHIPSTMSSLFLADGPSDIIQKTVKQVDIVSMQFLSQIFFVKRITCDNTSKLKKPLSTSKASHVKHLTTFTCLTQKLLWNQKLREYALLLAPHCLPLQNKKPNSAESCWTRKLDHLKCGYLVGGFNPFEKH